MELSKFSAGNEGREVFWNAEHFEGVLFAFTAVALAVFAYGIYRRWQMWSALGKPEVRTDEIVKRIKNLILNGIFQFRTFKDFYPGVMHGLIFYGFLVLIFGAAFDAAEFHIAEPLGIPFLTGRFYLVFSFLMELFGVFVLIGVFLAVDRRYITRPERLGYMGEQDKKPDDHIALLLIGSIVVTGFIVEALRIHVTNPPWEVWSFIGYSLSGAFAGMDYDTAKIVHKAMWWFHAFLSLSFIAYIPWSKLLHIVSTPANQFMASLAPAGSLTPIRDFETAESFGAGRLEDFTWKQIFDADACTRCGRCQDGCPAYLSGKPLSPQKMIQDIKTCWLKEAPFAIAAKKAAKTAAKTAGGGEDAEMTVPEKKLPGDVVDLHELWACTNCMYCMEHCPASIEHVPKIINMRQYKTLTEADFAPELQLTFRNMENNSNPWGVGSHLRAEWAAGAGIRTLAENAAVEYLFYVGCAGSFDDRGKKVSLAVAKILQAAGVSFGILGAEEGCCGDSAMRGGNEYLSQTLMQANIEIMKAYGVKKIICACPHGYNALKKEYPLLGGTFEVYHHTEIIAELIKTGRIVLTKPVEGLFTWHDSCFLGRYNGVYEQPRKILRAVPGMKLVEMDRNHDKSFCCGAGGARMWMEEDIGERIGNMRTDQAIAAQADVVAVACPFCLTMITDGIKARLAEEKMAALDIAEIVAQAMGLEDLKTAEDACRPAK